MTLNEVADLIISPEAERLACGNYTNRRGVRGYYLQVKCGNQWCKVSVSHAERHSDRITAEELHEIDRSTLQAIVIPTDSISLALRSRAAEAASLIKYENSTAVEGMWAEFCHNGHWYMISVSSIDTQVRARPEELETAADEFLWQQGHGRRPGRIAISRQSWFRH
jgi:hypothetical protein